LIEIKGRMECPNSRLFVEYRDGGHEQLISNGGRFKPAFAERDKCKPVHQGLSLAGNLVKPLLSLYGTKWRERGYGLRQQTRRWIRLEIWLAGGQKVLYCTRYNRMRGFVSISLTRNVLKLKATAHLQHCPRVSYLISLFHCS
jgi:hypothetical protein